MAKSVWGNRFGEACASDGDVAGAVDRFARDRRLRAAAGKEPVAGPLDLPPLTQHRQQLRREHHVAVLLALAVGDAQHHALRVDGGYGEPDSLGNAQAGGVAGGQDGAMLDGLDRVEGTDTIRALIHANGSA